MPGEWLHALACLGERSWAFPASFESPNTVFSHAWCSTYSTICGLALPFFYLSCFSNIQWSLTSGSLQCPAWDGSQPHLWNCWQTDITPNQAEVRPKRAHFFSTCCSSILPKKKESYSNLYWMTQRYHLPPGTFLTRGTWEESGNVSCKLLGKRN